MNVVEIILKNSMLKGKEEEIKSKEATIDNKEQALNISSGLLHSSQTNLKESYLEIETLRKQIEIQQAKLKEFELAQNSNKAILKSPDLKENLRNSRKTRKRKIPLLDKSYDMNASFFDEIANKNVVELSTPKHKKNTCFNKTPGSSRIYSAWKNSSKKKTL